MHILQKEDNTLIFWQIKALWMLQWSKIGFVSFDVGFKLKQFGDIVVAIRHYSLNSFL